MIYITVSSQTGLAFITFTSLDGTVEQSDLPARKQMVK
jgi:hypothetical protein